MPAGSQHAAALAWRVPSALRGGGQPAPSLVEVRPAGAPGSRRTECAHSAGRRRAAPTGFAGTCSAWVPRGREHVAGGQGPRQDRLIVAPPPLRGVVLSVVALI